MPETIACRELLTTSVAARPKLFGLVARVSDTDIIAQMDHADGNLLAQASGLVEETRFLYGRDDTNEFWFEVQRQVVG